MSGTLYSCSDDDNEGSQNSIEINGKKYPLSGVTFIGTWQEEFEEGWFTVSIDKVINGIVEVCYYDFEFKKSSYPKVGDDFSTLSLTMEASDDDNDFGRSFDYQSGNARCVGINNSKSKITIQFDQLKMSNRNGSYVFNGTVALDFTDDL